jgi:hypothetical protein
MERVRIRVSDKSSKSFLDHIREWFWVPIAAPVAIVFANQYLRSQPNPSVPNPSLAPIVRSQDKSLDKSQNKIPERSAPNIQSANTQANSPVPNNLLSCKRQNVSESTQAIPIQGVEVTVNLALLPEPTKLAKIECQINQPAAPVQFELDFGTADEVGERPYLEILLDGKNALSRNLGSGVRDKFSQQFSQKFEIQTSCAGDKCLPVYLFRIAPLNSF